MSIKRMTDVWEKSTHTSSDLLLLLALADNANDEGYCWPGIDKLCKKTRLSESTVIRRTRVIEKSGELVVKRSRRYGNKYLVVTGFTPEQIEALTKQYFGEKFLTGKLQDTSNLQNDSSELASCDSSELAPVTDDPSLTVIEPSKDSMAEPAMPEKPPTPSWDECKAAFIETGWVGERRVNHFLCMNFGKATGEYAKGNLKRPLSPEEIRGFPAWYRLPKKHGGAGMDRTSWLPRDSEKFGEYCDQYQAYLAKKAATLATPPALQFDPDAVFDITPRVWRPRPAGVPA